MAQRGDEQQHGGILIRGADGNLWFWRDDWNEARVVDGETTARIDAFMGFDPLDDLEKETEELLSFPVPDGVTRALGELFEFRPRPMGILHFRAARLRR
jgi:hypothetical protein